MTDLHLQSSQMSTFMECRILYCKDIVDVKNYCSKHGRQMKLYGQLINERKDKNPVVYFDTYAEMIIYNGHKVKLNFEDIEKVIFINWHYSDGYAYNKILRAMHKVIFKVPDGYDVDHKNHNKLDNRKFNLRKATRSQNVINIEHTWPMKGIRKLPGGGWNVRVGHQNKRYTIGTFKTLEEAQVKRDEALVNYFGEFATI